MFCNKTDQALITKISFKERSRGKIILIFYIFKMHSALCRQTVVSILNDNLIYPKWCMCRAFPMVFHVPISISQRNTLSISYRIESIFFLYSYVLYYYYHLILMCVSYIQTETEKQRSY